MNKSFLLSIAVCICVTGSVFADAFGTGVNQFNIDFVPISGDSGNLGSWPAGSGYTFSGVNHGDYRMGKLEISNDQWTKFQTTYGTVTGSPSDAYDENPYWVDTDNPTNNVSWYEAAQFINWLNIDSGHVVAYKFTGTQGTSGYSPGVWETGDIGYNASNPYRNRNAYYFLPTEDEWVKAAYWNGTNIQSYATKEGDTLHKGDGASGTGWNYIDTGWPTGPNAPWTVGSGSEELNGTFDMMGNAWEWMEGPYSGDYILDSIRGMRGGSYTDYYENDLRNHYYPDAESYGVGFRIASVPEPCTLLLLGIGGLLIRKR